MLCRVIALIAVSLFPLAAWAHGGEDHGEQGHDSAGLAAVGDVAPRATAQSEDFELVAVASGGKLTLYLDRHADNAPVAGATIEVESGAFKGVAREVEPGMYVLPGDGFARHVAQAGKYPLTLTVQADETTDLLTAMLDLAAPPPAGVEPVHNRGEWVVWGVAGALSLAGLVLIFIRRRKLAARE